MQGLHTHTAIRHAELTVRFVWDHLQNLGGSVGYLELDAYLHGLMPLPRGDRNLVAQAVNELLHDSAATGRRPCCRAPYSTTDVDRAVQGPRPYASCRVPVRGRWSRLIGTPGRPAAAAGRRPQGFSPLPPLRRDR